MNTESIKEIETAKRALWEWITSFFTCDEILNIAKQKLRPFEGNKAVHLGEIKQIFYTFQLDIYHIIEAEYDEALELYDWDVLLQHAIYNVCRDNIKQKEKTEST